ncbi:hypothetical protein [Bradyrhizobium sp.]|uniref:hypothetical protein n=1 Tax=Bradyrhizobium sp. TaxID=376 RepID=UPI002D497F57|nr:hypothetical protein [Bradyrhizobium sp.]HZR74048.1 hypothetical protein [Bradyrhizobium sp.]
MSKRPDLYDEKEAQERFEAALRGGLKTPHKPLKDKPKKKTKKRKSTKRTPAPRYLISAVMIAAIPNRQEATFTLMMIVVDRRGFILKALQATPAQPCGLRLAPSDNGE